MKKKLDKLQKEISLIEGRTTVFSNMSDWNPAEMIGSKPKNLSDFTSLRIKNKLLCEIKIQLDKIGKDFPKQSEIYSWFNCLIIP